MQYSEVADVYARFRSVRLTREPAIEISGPSGVPLMLAMVQRRGWSGQPSGCGNPASGTYNQCYPPAVNYTPLYYLINGQAFDKTHPTNSLFAAAPASVATPGTVLVRMVNAGLRWKRSAWRSPRPKRSLHGGG